MNFFRYHWFDFGLLLAILLVVCIYLLQISGLDLLMWLSLASLLFHQAEEWHYPGYLPGMVNVVMFKSSHPDRYPLNANSGMLINVILGWGGYLLAALFWSHAIWLAIATILVSIGNVIAHTFIFNIKGKTLYNPGLITSWLLFVPIIWIFFNSVLSQNLVGPIEWAIGISLGVALNYFGVFKMIIWLADASTPYIFPKRFLMPASGSEDLF